MDLYFEFRNAKEYGKRFSQGRWTFQSPGDKKKWYGTLTNFKENWILQPLKWWNNSKIQVIQYSRVFVL